MAGTSLLSSDWSDGVSVCGIVLPIVLYIVFLDFVFGCAKPAVCYGAEVV